MMGLREDFRAEEAETGHGPPKQEVLNGHWSTAGNRLPSGQSIDHGHNSNLHSSSWPPRTSHIHHVTVPSSIATPRNPRKRAREEDEDEEEAGHEGWGCSSFEDAMEEDGSPSSGATNEFGGHASYNGGDNGMAYGQLHRGSSSGRSQQTEEGGMLGRLKRVKMDDSSEDEVRLVLFSSNAYYFLLRLRALTDVPVASFARFNLHGFDSHAYREPPVYIDPMSSPYGHHQQYHPHHSQTPQHHHSPEPFASSPLPSRFTISLRTPGRAAVTNGQLRAPPVSPYAGVNSLLGQLHIQHQPRFQEDPGSLPVQHQQLQPAAAEIPYSQINTLLRQLEDSRRLRRHDHEQD